MNNIYDMPNLKNTLSCAIEKLNQIGNNKNHSSKGFQTTKEKLEQDISDDTPFVFASLRDIRFGFMALEIDENLLKKILNKNRIKEFIQKAASYNTDRNIAKYLLKIYYNYCVTIERSEGNQFFILKEYLKLHLRKYNKKSSMVLKAQKELNYLFDSLELIKPYINRDIIDFKNDFYLNDTSEFFEKIVTSRLIQKIELLNINAVDDKLFREIGDYKILCGIDIVRIMLNRCKEADINPSREWESFIISLVGDPRSDSNRHGWYKIGDELKKWFIIILSRGDLREFLESITDGQDNEIYKYRKAFWMAFIDRVQYVKLMVNESSIARLRHNNLAMGERFQKNKYIYSRLNDNSHSCIYMDFGVFHVIEGTHNAKLRIYSECPIGLSKASYDYREFYNDSVKNKITKERKHAFSSEYQWQGDILQYIKNTYNINIPIGDVILEEDKHRVLKIKDNLRQRKYL